MKIIYYPNKILETRCLEVNEFDGKLKSLISDMKKLMVRNNGVGLAANQIGESKRLFVMLDNRGVIHEIVNPKVLETWDPVLLQEGCLSFPDVFVEIERASQLVLEYQNQEGEFKRVVAVGIDARCIQHEVEHLNGITFLSKLSKAKQKEVRDKLKRDVND